MKVLVCMDVNVINFVRMYGEGVYGNVDYLN